MIRIREIVLPQEQDEHALLYHAAQALKIRASEIASLRIFRRSLDARKKPEIRWVYTVDVTLRSGEGRVLRQNRNPKITREEPYRYRNPRLCPCDKGILPSREPERAHTVSFFCTSY